MQACADEIAHDQQSGGDGSRDLNDGTPPDRDSGRALYLDRIRPRLAPMPGRDPMSWIATAVIVAIAAVLRFVKLSFPGGKIFDEIYYASGGEQLLAHSVEWRTDSDTADFVVHPPLGKWIIAAGIKLTEKLHYLPQDKAFGWRLMAAVAGVLSVLIIIRVARRMFRSTVLGCAAGLLMALDGMHFVLSRTAILDIFVLFFVLAAFASLVLDRDQRRARWLRLIENGLDPTRPGRAGRPSFGWSTIPWWRLVAGVMLGAAGSVKWSAIWFVPLFIGLIIAWEIGLRRLVGVRHPWRDALLDETGWIVAMGVLMFATYLASWSGWFLTDTGWKRHYLLAELNKNEPPVLGALYNLWAYHVDVYNFHVQLTAHHQYQSWPWQWLILGRPVAFHWSSDPGCGADNCASEILLLGTPVLWWSFIPALGALAWFAASRRDWRAWTIGLGVFAGIAPWFIYELDHRTMFYFYAAPAEPFLILAVVYVLGALMARPPIFARFYSVPPLLPVSAGDRRIFGTIGAGIYVLLVGVCFWYFYPIYVGTPIPYPDWLSRMWLGNRWV